MYHTLKVIQGSHYAISGGIHRYIKLYSLSNGRDEIDLQIITYQNPSFRKKKLFQLMRSEKVSSRQ